MSQEPAFIPNPTGLAASIANGDESRLTNFVDLVLARLGHQPPCAVMVQVTGDDAALAAGAEGMVLPLLGPVGRITIRTDLQNLADGEVAFVLAHEAAHIARSHIAARLGFDALRALAEDAGLSLAWEVIKVVMAAQQALWTCYG